MGERKARLQKMISDHPFCCFCGGTVATTTVEHAPPKVFFLDKRRPKGLEFPACVRCNNGTANSDQIAALLTTVMGTVHRPEIEENHSSHLDKLFKGVANNHPEIVKAFAASDETVPVKVNGKIESLQKVAVPDWLYEKWLNPWAAKQGYALWHEHQKSVLGSNAKVAVHWKTNFDLLDNDVPEKFSKVLSGIGELKQGKWETNEQYWYKYAPAEKYGEGIWPIMLMLQDASVVLIFISTGSMEVSESISKLPTFQTNADSGIHQSSKE